MSAICIFNIKESDCDYEELNTLSIEIISYAIQNKLGVFFNCRDYAYNLIEEAKMNNYFLLSDSFLYKNCEFISFDWNQFQEISSREKFANRYYFFEDIIRILFSHAISAIEIYVADEYIENISDFDIQISSAESIMMDLFDNVVGDSNHAEYFHPVKYVINR